MSFQAWEPSTFPRAKFGPAGNGLCVEHQGGDSVSEDYSAPA